MMVRVLALDTVCWIAIDGWLCNATMLYALCFMLCCVVLCCVVLCFVLLCFVVCFFSRLEIDTHPAPLSCKLSPFRPRPEKKKQTKQNQDLFIIKITFTFVYVLKYVL